MESKLLSKSFIWMFFGLLVTFLTGFVVSNNANMMANIFDGGYFLFVIIELALVIFLSARVMKLKPTTAKVCFLLYAFVSGLTFSSIFVVYELSSVMIVFLVAAAIFGLMSLAGYVTNMDLTKIGTYFIFGLIGVIVVSIVNIFLGNTLLDMILSVICLVLFVGITAYDVQKIKLMQNYGLPEDNVAIYGALQLYLDFINIFIHLLSLFGRDN